MIRPPAFRRLINMALLCFGVFGMVIFVPLAPSTIPMIMDMTCAVVIILTVIEIAIGV